MFRKRKQIDHLFIWTFFTVFFFFVYNHFSHKVKLASYKIPQNTHPSLSLKEVALIRQKLILSINE